MSNETPLTYVVIDIGYGYTKLGAILPDGTQIEPVTCPSAFARAGRILTEEAQATRPRLRLADETYYWGDHVRFARDPIFSRERKRSFEMLTCLFMGLLSETPISGDVRILTGLPVEWLDDADHVRAALSGSHEAVREDTGKTHSADVLSVDIYPQPQCAFFRYAGQDDTLWNDWTVVLVVDIGTGTSNVSFIEGGHWIDERAQSIPHGIGHALEQALQAQAAQQGGRDSILAARAKLWAGDPELLSYAAAPLEQLAGRIRAVIGDVVGETLVTMTILCGGGARFLGARLELPGILSLSETPELDNVHGLLTIAAFEREHPRG